MYIFKSRLGTDPDNSIFDCVFDSISSFLISPEITFLFTIYLYSQVLTSKYNIFI